MKLTCVAIHNYRGIHDCSLDLFDYNLLVGPNNAGKSTAIDAIRAFYEKDNFKYKYDRDNPCIAGKDQESWVEITFRLTDAEDASLSDAYRHDDKILRLRKYFKASDKSRDGSIYGYKSDESLSDESFYGAKNVQSGKIGDVVFIPAVSKVDDHTKLSGPSALRDLLTNVLEAVVESSPAYEQLSKDFEAFAGTIKAEQTADGRSLAGLESELTGLLDSWGASFQFDMKSPSTAEIIKSLLTYQCMDKALGKNQAIEQFGSGFQRHFIYSLIQIGAKYVGKKASRKTKDFTPSMKLILFEEPEAFLHPPQQEILAQNLASLSTNLNQQVICSTHSSHFVSRNVDNIPSIACFKREDGRVSVYQIDKESWNDIIDANQTINKIAARWPKLRMRLEAEDMKPEMEAIKYCLWLNPDRCGMFFANHVLVVEGTTEQAFINRLMGDDIVKRPSDGLYVLDAIGKCNIHRFMNLLTKMGIQHSVIYDDDKDKDYHAELNELIWNMKDDVLTTAIETVPENLESFLGIPKPADAHRKPQHLLFLYETGKIAEDKLKAFCGIVNACLP